MPNTSIGGLVSGLDTATIISQLIQLEARPQTMLKTQVGTVQQQLSSLQTVNAKLANVGSKAADLAKLSTWSPTKTTTDNNLVSVSATSSASPASLTFSIVQVATPSSVVFDNHLLTDKVTNNVPPTVQVAFADGRPAVALDTKDGTVKGLVDAINATDRGVRASAVLQNDGTYKLEVTSSRVGTASGFTLTQGGADLLIDSPTAVRTAGLGAEIKVGSDPSLTSDTNTFAELMPGVSVTLAAGATGTATVSVTRDTAGLAEKAKAMVEAVNAALDDIESLTAYKSGTTASGILAGDSTLRTVRDKLIATVTGGVGGQSLATVGIQVDRSGNVVFDQTKFKAAYDSDPSGTAAKFAGTATWSGSGTVTLREASWRTAAGSYTVDQGAGKIDGLTATVAGTIMTGATGTRVEGLSLEVSAGATGTITYKQGFAAALEALAQRVSNTTDGLVTNAITGRTTAIDRMEDDIAGWDVRLDQRRSALERQYGALEVALGKLQNQSTWLAGQISSLPKMGG